METTFDFEFWILILCLLTLLQVDGGELQEEALDLTLENGHSYVGPLDLTDPDTPDPHGPTPAASPVHAEVACGTCGKRVAKKALRLHALVHTGERRYSCALCGAGFMKKGDLNRHQRTHTGEKPFRCDVCDRAFNRKYLLRNHLVLAHKEVVKAEDS